MDTKKIDRREIQNDQDGEETLPLFHAPAFADDEEDTVPNFNTLPFFSGE